MNEDYPNVLITKAYLEELQNEIKELQEDYDGVYNLLLKTDEEFKRERVELMQIIQELCDIIKDSY